MNPIEAKKRKIEYFSYILGLAAFILLGKLIGNNGVTYMAVIMESISFFVLIINGRSAELCGRLIRARRKKNQYKEAGAMFKTIFMIQMIAGTVMTLIYLLLTDLLASSLFGLPFLSAALKILAPVILLNVLQNVIMGYFQGLGSHMPAVVSSLFRQLLFMLFGLILTGRLTAYGSRVSALLNNSDFTGMYGAVALCLAILISEFLVVLFLIIVYIGSDKKKEQKKAENGFQKTESFGERCRSFCLASLSQSMVGILKKMPFLLGTVLVLRRSDSLSLTVDAYGVFFRSFLCVGALPVILIIMGMLNNLCNLKAALKRKDNREVRGVIYAGLHYSWSAGLFTAVLLAVLAPLFSNLFDAAQTEMLQKYYMYGAAVIALTVLDVYLWMMLQTMGAYRMNILSLFVLNGIFGGGYFLLETRGMDNIVVLCLAALAGTGVQCILSFVYALRKYVLQPDMIRGFVIPVAGSGAAGLAVMLMRNLLAPHLGNGVCLFLCLITGVVLYLAVLIFTRSVRENEVNWVYGPIGRKIFGLIIR